MASFLKDYCKVMGPAVAVFLFLWLTGWVVFTGIVLGLVFASGLMYSAYKILQYHGVVSFNIEVSTND